MSSTINAGRVADVGAAPPIVLDGRPPEKLRGLASFVSKNILASLARVSVVSVVALVLPAYLTQHLPVTTYSAWVLILQLAAYVSYFDLGIQTAVSKFVAEYEAKGDRDSAGRHASAGLVLMMLAGTLGVALTLALAWQVPNLFHTMPASLYHDVRTSVVLVGFSLSFGLVCAVYSAVFLGLQRYWIPMSISIINRTSFAGIVIAVVALHGQLGAMGIAVAFINVGTGLSQILAWKKKASHVRMSAGLVDVPVLKRVARYCSLQSVWTIGLLCVAGLDVTIVGHYDYGQTAYYSIATLPTSFLLLIMSSIVGPLMPASSAMSTQLSSREMGAVLAKVTRYSTIVLLLTGLPLIVCGMPLLRMWVGASYAVHTIRYLRILVFANIIRNFCLPYATMISATGRQEAAIITAVAEAVVNLSASLYLAGRFGGVGVAIGTLLGALVSVSLHFIVTMHFTRSSFDISCSRLFLSGLLRPAVIALPSLAILLLEYRSGYSLLGASTIILWAVATFALAAFAAINAEERRYFRHVLGDWIPFKSLGMGTNS